MNRSRLTAGISQERIARPRLVTDFFLLVIRNSPNALPSLSVEEDAPDFSNVGGFEGLQWSVSVCPKTGVCRSDASTSNGIVDVTSPPWFGLMHGMVEK